MKKVEAWQTSDGELFALDKKDRAVKHQEKINLYNQRKSVFEEKKLWFEYYVRNVLEIDFEDDGYIGSYYEKDGWKCGHKDNPIDVCIYHHEVTEKWSDECCIFCGQPEERK